MLAWRSIEGEDMGQGDRPRSSDSQASSGGPAGGSRAVVSRESPANALSQAQLELPHPPGKRGCLQSLLNDCQQFQKLPQLVV